MKHRGVIIIASLVLCAAPLLPARAQGQYSQCETGTTSLRDACYKAVDIFNYVAPQLSASVASGNATLGVGSTLGGWPHWTAEFRASGMSGSLPAVSEIHLAHDGRVASDIPVKSQPLGLPTVNAAVGIFQGFPLTLTNTLGVDALISASYVPTFEGATVGVRPTSGSLRLGYGVRVGILQESPIMPGLSVTYMIRNLPTSDVIGTTVDQSSGARDTVGVRNLSLNTRAWRITASKDLMMFGVVIGGGQDRYSSSGNLSVFVKDDNGCSSGCTGSPFGFKQTITRTNVFADVSVNFYVAKLVGELGRVSGGSVPSYNSFQGSRADDARTYGSIGFRVQY